MNCLLFLVFLAVATNAQQNKSGLTEAKISEIFINCQKEFKVTDQEMLAYQQHPTDPAYATNNIKCQLKCGVEKLGLYKNNQPVEAAIIDIYSKLNSKVKVEDIKKTLAACKTQKGANDCDTVYKIMACFRKAGL